MADFLEPSRRKANVLVIGSGGREHALVWKLKQSPNVGKIYAAPGNAGIGQIATLADIQLTSYEITRFADRKFLDLVVIGPEQPLVDGLTHDLTEYGLNVFGPTKSAAMIEGSKRWSKRLMKEYGIPTADYRDYWWNENEKAVRDAREHFKESEEPIVIKADGLASGKGVYVCRTADQAAHAVKSIAAKQQKGLWGNGLIIEDFVRGEELSVLAITDGSTFGLLPSAQDHKTAYDGDRGPNTGGMGAYSPAPVATQDVLEDVGGKVFEPILHAMSKRDAFFQGCLYAGLMITDKGPSVLEFNCRFGDPETQAVLPLFDGDLYETLYAVSQGRLNEVSFEQRRGAATAVVMASEGYPESYERGKAITIGRLPKNVSVFHSGTARKGGKLVTDGGRVLTVTGYGSDIESSIRTAYAGVERITWEGEFHRSDIGHRALRRPTSHQFERI